MLIYVAFKIQQLQKQIAGLSSVLHHNENWELVFHALQLTPDELKLIIGGEMAMWTDYYCYIQECFMSQKPVAWWMFPEKYDSEFIESVSNLVRLWNI